MNKENRREQYGFINMPMPADLRDELKQQAASQGVLMHELATQYLRDILDDHWRPAHEYGTVQVCVKLEPHEVERLKRIAASSNLSISRYVREYHNHRANTNTKQSQHETCESTPATPRG